MTKDEKIIFDALLDVLTKISEMETRTNGLTFKDDAIDHISYAMECVSGISGVTDRVKKEMQQEEEMATSDKSKN